MIGKCVAERPWAIILAGGNGVRLQSLTRNIDGDARPKQFSKIFGERSLLGHTRERLRPIFGNKKMFVVTKEHDSFYKEELIDIDRARVVEQPANRGTGVAIVAALLHLMKQEDDAIIGVFPSDHYYADNEAFARTVKSAIDVSNEHNSIVLIGAKPEWPEVEFGWIEPGVLINNRISKSLFGVSGFCEKPSLNTARTLMRKGALWNTFISIGPAGAFLKLLMATVTATMCRFADAIARGNLCNAYNAVETIDFSKHVLSAEPSALLVLADCASGWADLGNPTRVIETLARHEIEPNWLREMRRLNVPPLMNSQHVRQQTSQDLMRHIATV